MSKSSRLLRPVWVLGLTASALLGIAVNLLEPGSVQLLAIGLALLWLAAATFGVAYERWGSRTALKVLLLIAAMGAAADTLGSVLGFPFGRFDYAAPAARVFAPLIWIVVGWNSIEMASALFPKLSDPLERLLVVNVAALLSLTGALAWEPVISQIHPYRLWLDPGVYAALPGFFLFGWFMMNFLAAALLISRLPADKPQAHKGRDKEAFSNALTMLALFQMPLAIADFRAGFYVPVFLSINLLGGLAIYGARR
ncbi:MAG: carotenoid biosynthesis protein [Verrucomicrobiae bacterium]|nr:carotenoid biosynthesis protein [Verrucomicrobiae bacterium]